MVDLLATLLPIYLTYKREIDPNAPSSPLNSVRRIFREAFILFPALFFMLNLNALSYALIFAMLFIVLHSIYEVGYVYNDWIRIRYEEKPTIRRYVEDINPLLSIILRGIYIVSLSFFLFSLSYIYAVLLLMLAIVNHNRKVEKYKQLITLPLMRTAKYMFVPIAMSGFNIEFLGGCLVLLLPLFIMEGEAIAGSVIRFYDHPKTSFRFPYYVWFLTFLPFQALLLFRYPIWIFSGELLFMAISVVRHR